MPIRRLSPRRLVWLAFLLTGCDDDEAAASMEAGRIVHAVKMLRRAPPDDKGPPLAALEAIECSEDRCEVKDTCVEAYGLHVRGLQAIRAARASMKGRTDPATASAAASLSAAERDLRRSSELAKRCAEEEAAMKRRYSLD